MLTVEVFDACQRYFGKEVERYVQDLDTAHRLARAPADPNEEPFSS